MSRRSLLRIGFLLALLASCGSEGPEGPARRVILITCDTLRADRLGVYGYERGTSPAIDAFAREALVFEEAYAAAPFTQPAISSMLTGLLPEEIGVMPGNARKLPARIRTLPEILSSAGIDTAAVVSNWVLFSRPGSGIGVRQGFDHFDARFETREKNRDVYERIAPDTTDAAIDWLRARGDRGRDGPFFLWVHYQDPHGPYTPPPDVAARFDRPPEKLPRIRHGRGTRGEKQIPIYQILDQEHRASVYRDRYDGEVFLFDRELGRLFDCLSAEGLDEEAMILLSADHGESLGEKEFWFCHGENLQREVLRVPLIIRYPDGAPQPPSRVRGGYRRCDQMAGLVDLSATVLDAFGLPPVFTRGVSLLRSEPLPERVITHSLAYDPRGGRRKCWGSSDGRYRLVWDDWEPEARLFDIREDPQELHDLAAALPEVAQGLRREWDRIMASVSLVEGDEGDLSADDRRRLEALGY